MSSSKSIDLFYLIKSMTKSEKRAFKLYAKRGSGTEHLFLKLFDIIDSLDELDENTIQKKIKLDSVSQYSNLKRHLYSQILSSLRMLKVEKIPNIKIREYIDLAYVLYDKGLYMQALNILNTAKALCNKYGTDLSLLTILEIEKNIHSRHITRIKENTFDDLLSQSLDVSDSLSDRVHLTNLKLRLHKMYIQNGHVKNEIEYKKVEKYFSLEIKSINFESLGMMEKIYYCQCHVWYNYVIEDYNSCLQYAKQWVDLFTNSEYLQKRDYNLCLRGFHYVLTSAFNLNNLKEHNTYLTELENFRTNNYSNFNENNKIFSFLYTHTGRLNEAFLSKDFESGINAIPRTLRRIKRYRLNLDQHKIMVLHYKIAWMYICAEKTELALPYIDEIISLKRQSLREDIQSYTRLMHLMALYDMEDYNGILQLLRKYKYYFEQVKETNELQKAALKYFYQISTAPIFERKKMHQNFYEELKEIQKSNYEKRAFVYLDIIYWVKQKIKGI